MLLSLQALLLIHFHGLAAYTTTSRKPNTSSNYFLVPATIRLSYTYNGDVQERTLTGRYSSYGSDSQVSGTIVQALPFRVCREPKEDHTMPGHAVVIMYGSDTTYLTGCISLKRQIEFASVSKAKALVLGPESRIDMKEPHHADIPVILLNESQTRLLSETLIEAKAAGSGVKFMVWNPTSSIDSHLHLQVLRPTVVNIGLFIFLVLLVLFIAGLVFIKIKWRSGSHRDIHLRAMAKSALNKMEIRKFVKNGSSRKPCGISKKGSKLFCFAGKSRNFSMLGSLYSIAPSCDNQEKCSICLEEYREGQELRVLFCGHEFHSKCVDPWLLSNPRCPLCLFDVVYKQYPEVDKAQSPKVHRVSSAGGADRCTNQQEVPLLSSRNNASEASSSLLSVVIPYMQIPHETNVHSDWKQRYRRSGINERFGNRYPMSSSTTVRAEVSDAESSYRRRRDMIARRLSKRNFHHKSRVIGTQHRRRYHKPRMVQSTPAKVCARDELAEPSEAISGYSSDVSSYPDSERPRKVDDLALLLYSFSFSSDSDEGMFNGDSNRDDARCKRFPTALRPQNRISIHEPYHLDC